MRTSVIQHPASSPFLILRSEYINLCLRNHCAASLLAVFEFLTNGDLMIRGTHDPYPIKRSVYLLNQDLMGLYAEDKIRESLQSLVEFGYLLKTAKSTYLLMADNINRALNMPVMADGGENPPNPENRVCKPGKSGLASDPSLLTVEEEDIEEPLPPTTSPMDLPPLTGNVVKAVKARMDARGLGASLSQSTCQQIRKKESWFRSQGSEEHRDFLDGLAQTIDDFAEDPSIGTINSALMGYQRGKESRERAPKVGFSHPERKPPPASRAESPAQRRIAEAFQEHGFMLGEEMDWKWRVLEARLADQGNDGFWPWLGSQLAACEDLGLSSGGAFEALFTEAKRLAMRKPTFEEELADSMKGEAL